MPVYLFKVYLICIIRNTKVCCEQIMVYMDVLACNHSYSKTVKGADTIRTSIVYARVDTGLMEKTESIPDKLVNTPSDAILAEEYIVNSQKASDRIETKLDEADNQAKMTEKKLSLDAVFTNAKNAIHGN